MTQKFLQEQKKKLEKTRQNLEEELKRFAKKDPKLAGNWDTRFPQFGIRTSEQDENMDEVEEYENLLPVEYDLEVRLLKIKKALKKIKNKTYGTCLKCRKGIKIERLKAYPEAENCIKCAKSP